VTEPLSSLTDEALGAAARRAVRALPDAPADWLQRAIDLVPAPPSLLARVAAAGRRQLAAVLSVDSWAQPSMALGMRSSAASTHQLLYTADGRDLDLRIVAEGATYAVGGQVLGADVAGEVELAVAAGSEPPRVAALDDLGGFRIAGVAGGRYALTLRLAGDEIVLPPLEIGEPPR